jgi:O-antigen/teichoic acid export membrane protein
MQVLGNVANSAWWLASNGVPALIARYGIHRETLMALLRSGAMFFALQVAVAFAFQSDSVVITHVLGAAAYGDFSVVQRLFLFVSALLSTGIVALWPAFGDAMARGDVVWARRALLRALAIAGGVASLACGTLVLSLGFVTAHWLHMTTPPPLMLAIALATWTTIDAMGAVSGTFMNASNVLRAQIVFALLMASLAFVGKWWLTPRLGPPGAVLATIGAYCLVSIPAQIFIFSRLFASSRSSA